LVHISELAERHVEVPEQVVQVGTEIFVKIIDIDLDRRRISLSLKQANEAVSPDQEDFDPTLYGMAADYDEQGNYKYPEGFDPESGEWLEGFEVQRDEWERNYAEAQARFEAHRKQVEEAQAAEADAANAPAPEEEDDYTGGQGTGGAGSVSSSGALASDEALAALREKLAGGEASAILPDRSEAW